MQKPLIQMALVEAMIQSLKRNRKKIRNKKQKIMKWMAVLVLNGQMNRIRMIVLVHQVWIKWQVLIRSKTKLKTNYLRKI